MHLYLHTTMGICLWNLLAVIVFAVVVVVLVGHIYKQKKRQNEFEQKQAGQRNKISAGTANM